MQYKYSYAMWHTTCTLISKIDNAVVFEMFKWLAYSPACAFAMSMCCYNQLGLTADQLHFASAPYSCLAHPPCPAKQSWSPASNSICQIAHGMPCALPQTLLGTFAPELQHASSGYLASPRRKSAIRKHARVGRSCARSLSCPMHPPS